MTDRDVSAWLDELSADETFRSHPLFAQLQLLAEKYTKLVRRLDKISKISDSFQVQLKELNGALQLAALTDALCGLPNRRAMIDCIRKERNRSARNGRTFCLIMGDIDRFKQVNDTFGHEAGDDVLVATSATLRQHLRGYDVCSRWGGEEFLILLPETTLDGGIQTAKKLCEAVASQRITIANPVPGGSFRPAKCVDGEAARAQTSEEVVPRSLRFVTGTEIAITMSLGVSVFDHSQSIDACIREADRTLYAAKATGGNCCRHGALAETPDDAPGDDGA